VVALKTYYIGWDVGAWHCDRNRRSRDSICVLEHEVGKPQMKFVGVWRNNFSKRLLGVRDSQSFVADALILLDSRFSHLDTESNIVLAIDAPLGFPTEFNALIQGKPTPKFHAKNAIDNPYVYRETERFLRLQDSTLHPLSPIQDQIGSQATKALHLIYRLGLRRHEATWVSTEADSVAPKFRAIETYPSVAIKMRPNLLRDANLFDETNTCNTLMLEPDKADYANRDKRDALICALVASMWGRTGELMGPRRGDVNQELVEQEGWIWVPETSC